MAIVAFLFISACSEAAILVAASLEYVRKCIHHLTGQLRRPWISVPIFNVISSATNQNIAISEVMFQRYIQTLKAPKLADTLPKCSVY